MIPSEASIRRHRPWFDFLDEGGGLTDDLLLAAANEGEIGFVAEYARASRRNSDRFRQWRSCFQATSNG